MSSNIHVYTHNDLDGVGCLLALIWSFPDSTITYTCVSNPDSFAEQFQKSIHSNKIQQYDKVFVTDLSLHQKDIPLIDFDNVIFIDHHKTSLNLNFTKAKSFIKIISSCTLYIYNLFKSQIKINKQQKQLLVYIDDYDSYQLSFNISKTLNVLFWSHYHNNTSLFLQDFMEGYSAFTPLQLQAIKLHNKKLESVISSLSLYTTTTQIQGKATRIIAAFASDHINDISTYIIQKHSPDVVVIVNIKNERVSFRRNISTTIDVSAMARSLCGGGGHEASAGGSLTENFLMFSKLFKPL